MHISINDMQKMISVKSGMRDWKNNDSADVIYYFRIVYTTFARIKFFIVLLFLFYHFCKKLDKKSLKLNFK